MPRKTIAGIAAAGALAVLSSTFYFGAPPRLTNTDDIIAAQEAYFAKHGTYLQIMQDNQLPHYEKGSAENKLSAHIPNNAEIHTYRTPENKQGFQIIFFNPDGTTQSISTGPEAKDRTWTPATTTP